MSSFRQYYRKSIARRFMSMMMMSLTLILCGAIFVLWSTIGILKTYERAMMDIGRKQEIVTELTDHSTEFILRARGYYVFLTDYEYEELFKEKDRLNQSLNEIKKLKLNPKEQELMFNIEAFYNNYMNEVLPKAIEFAKQEDYESLRKLISADKDNPVNQLIEYSQQFENQMRQGSKENGDKLVQSLSLQAFYFIGYIVLILILSCFITRKLVTDMGVPLKQLTNQARRFADGEQFELHYKNREDEIGELTRSFQLMLEQIQHKEEVLLAQNEELIAQQDELQAQQLELQGAVGQMEKNERHLEKRNQIIQSMSNTLDKQELLDSIIHSVVEITESDKGLIVMMNAQYDYASVGISAEAAKQFIHRIEEGIVLRARDTKQAYNVIRQCTPAEQGYHTEPMTASELTVPILNANEEMVACLILTKVNRIVSKQEVMEIMGIMTQVSLAFDKLEMYEQSEKQRLMTGDMLNTIQEGVQLMDLQGRTLQINRKMSEIFGFFQSDFDATDLAFDQFAAIVEASVIDPQPLIAFMGQLIEDDQFNEQRSTNYEIKEPNRRFIQIYCEPLYRDGYKFGLLLVHRDITKEHEVDRMKSEFVSTVSHELRTPLASVLGFAELLLHRELKPERQRKYVTTIHQEARRLTTLINDFLDLQRMESGKQTYEIKPLSLMPLIDEVIELQQISASNHRISWNKETQQVLILADQDKMQQVFINLLSNAIKYSPAGGEIRISSITKNNQVVIRIEDEGLGIPKDAIPNLFNKFYRVDNSDRREIGGTGLGLAIVKEIITSHKGSIEVASEFGKGSVFMVSLPLAPLQENYRSEEQQEVTLPESSTNVMLIENDHNLSTLLRDELQASGFRVHLFTEGLKALEVIEQLNPAIVVIDLMLEPDITGWDIIGMMKKSNSLQNKPIIISSAFEEKKKAAQWGIKEFLVKPYLPGKLSAAIQRLLR